MISVGNRVSVRGQNGTVRYVGSTDFAPGEWIGVELDTPNGKNNGSVNNKAYFECAEHHGVFVRASMVDPPDSELSLHRVIDRLQAKLRSATHDIKEYRQTIAAHEKELQHARTLESQVEMLSTDKDFLVQKNGELEGALKKVTEDYEALKKDVAALQEELDVNRQLEDAIKSLAVDNVSASDFQLIVSRNAQLESTIAGLEALVAEANTNKGAAERLEVAEATIQSLQGQLEAALDLDKIVSHLTAENEQLLAQVAELRKSVAELSELHELDKSLEHSQAEVEQKLKSDISQLSKVIQDDKMLISDLERKNKYLENKFSEYRTTSNRNSSITLAPDYYSDDDTLTNIHTELELLKLEVRKHKLASFADRLSLRVSQAKLDLLHRFDPLALSLSTNLKNGYRVLYEINLNMAYTTIILDTITTLSRTETHQLSNFISVRLQFNHLNVLLQALAHLWEFNYATKHYVTVMPSLRTVLSELNNNLLVSLAHVKEADLDSVPTPSYIGNFVAEVLDLLKLEFVSDTYLVIFQNVSLFKVYVSNIHHESVENVNLLRLMSTYINRYYVATSDTDDLINELHAKVGGLLEEANAVVANLTNLLRQLNEVCEHSKDITISIKTSLNFHEPSVAFRDLNKILRKIEVETYTIHDDDDAVNAELLKEIFEFDFDVESWGTLDTISQAFRRSQRFLDCTYESYEKQAQSIYDLVANPPTPASLDEPDTKSERLVESQHNDLHAKLQEKDQKIQDLQLNVRLLEKNMASSDAKSKEYVAKMKKELAQLRTEYEGLKKSYDHVIKANKDLELEIQHILKSHQLLETSQLVGKFADLQSEKKFTEEMALVEEVLLLRKILNNRYSQYNPPTDDLRWLDQLIIPNMPPAPQSARDFKQSGEKIRALAQETQPVRIQGQGGWRPRANLPKYINTLIEEKKRQYQHERNALVLSSFN